VTAVFIVAAVRDQVADFLAALLLVYTLLIFGYIVTSIILAFGGRIPYSRTSSAILGFLREVCEPYLRIFRRFIPPLGPIDISPMIGIFVLQIVGSIIINIVRGP
jgi:YggT family protein